MSDSEEEVTASKGESLSDLVDILQEHPVVFQKSMLLDARQRRSAALSHIKEKYERRFSIGIKEGQLCKKLVNIKTRLKKKSDHNMTGNKPIILNDWEEKLYNLIEDDTNPSVNKAPGAVTCDLSHCGQQEFMSSPLIAQEMDSSNSLTSLPIESPSTTLLLSPPLSKHRRSNTVFEKYETEETKQLNIGDLQRLVLLQQLAILKEQSELYKEMRERLTATSNSDNMLNNVPTYFML